MLTGYVRVLVSQVNTARGGGRMSLKSLVKKYLKSLQEVKKHGEEVCNVLVKNLREVIPDLECTLGWSEAGVDTICLWSDARDVRTLGIERAFKMKRLGKIIEDEMPELRGHLDTPYGVYVTDEEAERIRRILRKIWGE